MRSDEQSCKDSIWCAGPSASPSSNQALALRRATFAASAGVVSMAGGAASSLYKYVAVAATVASAPAAWPLLPPHIHNMISSEPGMPVEAAGL